MIVYFLHSGQWWWVCVLAWVTCTVFSESGGRVDLTSPSAEGIRKYKAGVSHIWSVVQSDGSVFGVQVEGPAQWVFHVCVLHFWVFSNPIYIPGDEIFLCPIRSLFGVCGTPLYEKAMSARVSEALLLVQWRNRALPHLPGGLKWGSWGLKVLGVFLGTE